MPGAQCNGGEMRRPVRIKLLIKVLLATIFGWEVSDGVRLAGWKLQWSRRGLNGSLIRSTGAWMIRQDKP